MSRGGLMLRSAASGDELEYGPLTAGVRPRGPRPPKLDPSTRVPPTTQTPRRGDPTVSVSLGHEASRGRGDRPHGVVELAVSRTPRAGKAGAERLDRGCRSPVARAAACSPSIGILSTRSVANPTIEYGTKLRLQGQKKLLDEIKANEKSMIEITGLMKQSEWSSLAWASPAAVSASRRPCRWAAAPPMTPGRSHRSSTSNPGGSQRVVPVSLGHRLTLIRHVNWSVSNRCQSMARHLKPWRTTSKSPAVRPRNAGLSSSLFHRGSIAPEMIHVAAVVGDDQAVRLHGAEDVLDVARIARNILRRLSAAGARPSATRRAVLPARCEAGHTKPLVRRTVARSACLTGPRIASSNRTSPGRIARPAASAEVQPSGRRAFDDRSNTAPEPASHR